MLNPYATSYFECPSCKFIVCMDCKGSADRNKEKEAPKKSEVDREDHCTNCGRVVHETLINGLCSICRELENRLNEKKKEIEEQKQRIQEKKNESKNLEAQEKEERRKASEQAAEEQRRLERERRRQREEEEARSRRKEEEYERRKIREAQERQRQVMQQQQRIEKEKSATGLCQACGKRAPKPHSPCFCGVKFENLCNECFWEIQSTHYRAKHSD